MGACFVKSKYNSKLIARLCGTFAYVEKRDMKKLYGPRQKAATKGPDRFKVFRGDVARPFVAGRDAPAIKGFHESPVFH
jgi:hypothetical protein